MVTSESTIVPLQNPPFPFGLKYCPQCLEFHDKGTFIHRSAVCQRCVCGNKQQWAIIHRERLAQQHHKNYLNNKEERSKQKKEYNRINKDIISQKRRAYRLMHQDRIKKQKQDHYQKNKEKIKSKSRQWHKDHPEKRKQIMKKYHALHPEINRLREAKRRARKRLLPYTFSDHDRQFALQYWNYACAICGRENGFWYIIAFDHWIPIMSPQCPGTIPGNMIPLCHKKKGAPREQYGCNSTKSSKDPATWLKEIFTPHKAAQKLRAIQSFLIQAEAHAQKQRRLPSLFEHADPLELGTEGTQNPV